MVNGDGGRSLYGTVRGEILRSVLDKQLRRRRPTTFSSIKNET
jgi:hypothetical protein